MRYSLNHGTSAHETRLSKTKLLQNPSRSVVFDYVPRGDAVKTQLNKSKSQQFPQSFRRETLAPKRPVDAAVYGRFSAVMLLKKQ